MLISSDQARVECEILGDMLFDVAVVRRMANNNLSNDQVAKEIIAATTQEIENRHYSANELGVRFWANIYAQAWEKATPQALIASVAAGPNPQGLKGCAVAVPDGHGGLAYSNGVAPWLIRWDKPSR